MLSLEKVKNGLETFGYEYANNILCGHTKSKVKWVLPAAPVTVIASEKVTSYLFGFDEQGIYIFPVDGNYSILDCLLLEWKDIKEFEVKKGLLLENTMNIVTNEMSVSLKINKTVAGNSWVKENVKTLEELNYYKK